MAERVVTLPPKVRGDDAAAFAAAARRHGATSLELRTDLHDEASVPVASLAAHLALIVSERGRPLLSSWLAVARWVDRPLGASGVDAKTIVSHHAAEPLTPDQAVQLWSAAHVPDGARVKHVEPLGEPAQGWRLLETQRRLQERFGTASTTVLATGSLALPFRSVLAEKNAFDYVALSADWEAAPGQRLLDDAVRATRARRGALRLGILGSSIEGSRSPRIHQQPFDRIDLPVSATVGELIEALTSRYRGLAVTSPFKKILARHLGSPLEAVNTLFRRQDHWESANTDVDGATAVLRRLLPTGGRLCLLGNGGAAAAIRLAAASLGIDVETIRRANISERPIEGAVIWTWPDRVEPPAPLRFRSARVAVISYGVSARRVGAKISALGGTPVFLGPRWFIAQARAQRRLWESAE